MNPETSKRPEESQMRINIRKDTGYMLYRYSFSGKHNSGYGASNLNGNLTEALDRVISGNPDTTIVISSCYRFGSGDSEKFTEYLTPEELQELCNALSETRRDVSFVVSDSKMIY